MNTASSTTFGKLILAGEHSVIHGGRAISFPVTRFECRVTIEEGGALEIVDTRKVGTKTAEEMCSKLGIAKARVTIDSKIPLNAGLGSSAALAVALTRAAAEFRGRELTEADVIRIANELESIPHGVASGVDVSTIVRGRTTHFISRRDQEDVQISAPVKFFVAIIPRESSTKDSVAGVRERIARKEIDVDFFRQASDVIVDEILAELKSGANKSRVGGLLGAAQELLSDLGVSSPEQDALVREFQLAGAFGAKLSGAGFGGATIALIPQQYDSNFIDGMVYVSKRHGARESFVVTVN
ncbi:MAG: mevalonate kinase [Planctomycetes bacterium]|nr:mevalonate kinase [Planctomycetota bacterium]